MKDLTPFTHSHTIARHSYVPYNIPMLELILAIVILLSVAIWIYNQLVRDRNQVLSAWSDIDVQLTRRHVLVPQLVTVVKAYADYEKATMTAVTELRARSFLWGLCAFKKLLLFIWTSYICRVIDLRPTFIW